MLLLNRRVKPLQLRPPHRPSPKKTLPLKNLSPRPKLRGPMRPNLKIRMKCTWCTPYPCSHIIIEPWNNYPPIRQEIRHESPYYVTHSYNTNRPSPYVSEHAYIRSPPRNMTYHSVESYGEGYHQDRGSEGDYQNHTNDGNQITSMFSDENPNACTIV